MTPELIAPAISAFALLVCAAAIGVPMVRKIILVREARHELRYGSAGFLRGVAGWSVVVVWIAATWFVATIIGDWGRTGDLDGAMARAWLRLRVLMEIVIAVMQSD